jgi:uncharacterized repeat protein (TIGR04042 family)
MPELSFTVHWPDGTRMPCHSPSTIIRHHLASGSYDLEDFLIRARQGFAAASERVRLIHGHPCSQAAAQLRAIEAEGRRFDEPRNLRVTIDPY